MLLRLDIAIEILEVTSNVLSSVRLSIVHLNIILESPQMYRYSFLASGKRVHFL